MELKIKGLGAIQDASISFAPGVTLVAGENGAGKSTILRAIAACMTRDPVPLHLPNGKGAVNKKETALMLSKERGLASIETEEGKVTVRWPSNLIRVEGNIETASPMAAGMVEWMALSEADRRKILMNALEQDGMPVNPTKDDLQRWLHGKVSDQRIGEIWQLIEEVGWDGAEKEVSHRWSQATGAWRQVTGEAYGANKADGWAPDGWGEELAVETEEGLESAASAARRAVDDGIARQAVDQSEIDRWRVKAEVEIDDPQKYQEQIDRLQAEIEGLEEKRSEYQTQLKPIPIIMSLPEESNKNAVCPECLADLYVDGLNVWRAKTIDEDELQSVREDIAQAEAQAEESKKHNAGIQKEITAISKILAGLQEQARQTAIKLQQAERDVAERAKAQDLLEKMLAEPGNLSQEDVDALKKAEWRAKNNLHLFRSKAEADELAVKAKELFILKGALHQNGLRADKMAAAMSEVNSLLRAVCSRAMWPEVTIDQFMNLSYAGRPFVVCSRSEQYRCQATIQILLATIDGSQVLLLDGADILDSAGRLGLLKALHPYDGVAVIAMTAKQDYAQQVSELFNAAFWINNGSVDGLK